MADNQQVNIRASADTAEVSSKLDALSAKIDMMGNSAQKATRKSKRGTDEAKGAFSEMGAEVASVGAGMMKNLLSVTAVVTGVTAAIREMIQERARAAGEAGQDEGKILFGTGDAASREQVKQVLTGTQSVFSYKQELQVFDAFRGAAPGISTDDVLGTIPSVLTGPGFVTNDLNSTKDFAGMVGKLMQQGYTRDDALSRATLFMQQAGNRGGDLVTKGATMMGQLGAVSEGGRDTALALQLAGIRNGIFRTDFVTSSLGQLESSQRTQATAAAKAQAAITGEDEEAILNRILPQFMDPEKNLGLLTQALEGGPGSTAFSKIFTSAESVTKARAIAGAPYRRAMAEIQQANYADMIAAEQAALGPDARLVREAAMHKAAEEDATMARGTEELQMSAYYAARRRALAEDGSTPWLANIPRVAGYALKTLSPPLRMSDATPADIAEFIGNTGRSDRMSPMGPEAVPTMGMNQQPSSVIVDINLRSDDSAGFVADIESVQY